MHHYRSGAVGGGDGEIKLSPGARTKHDFITHPGYSSYDDSPLLSPNIFGTHTGHLETTRKPSQSTHKMYPNLVVAELSEETSIALGVAALTLRLLIPFDEILL